MRFVRQSCVQPGHSLTTRQASGARSCAFGHRQRRQEVDLIAVRFGVEVTTQGWRHPDASLSGQQPGLVAPELS